MPRIAGYRERRHQPLWDTLVRAEGPLATPLNPETRLFGNANVGDRSRTNLDVAGQLASDQTYVALALRAWLFFDGDNRRELYLRTVSQLQFTLVLGDKPQFFAPCWYFPAGGGIWGFDSTASVLNNGEPGQSEIMKLARPIILPVRQNFTANAQFFSVGGVSALDLINGGANNDQKIVQFMIDGLQTRDVQ